MRLGGLWGFGDHLFCYVWYLSNFKRGKKKNEVVGKEKGHKGAVLPKKGKPLKREVKRTTGPKQTNTNGGTQSKNPNRLNGGQDVPTRTASKNLSVWAYKKSMNLSSGLSTTKKKKTPSPLNQHVFVETKKSQQKDRKSMGGSRESVEGGRIGGGADM